ncbi:MAG: cbb3-type cytochrome c oxidase subunit I [Cyclobacteriaceae bacterium]|nr:cbb3-type cytochrome c oxidase subunit I [Cyclobacteriaceae bacterium]
MKDTNQNLIQWLALAVLAIGFMGFFSLEIALARTPFLQHYITSPTLFYRALCVHVIFAMVVWLMVFNVCIWHLYLPLKNTLTGRISKGLTFLSIGLFAAVGIFEIGQPYLNNYVPVIDHPVFWTGLIFFTLAYLLELLRFSPYINALLKGDVQQQLMSFSFLLSFLCIAIALISLMGTERTSDVKLFFEKAFWVPGHIQQFLNACIMLLCWHYLVKRNNNNYRITNNYWIKIANGSMLFFAFTLLSGLFINPLSPTFRFVTVLSYGLGLGIPVLIHSFFLIKYFRWKGFASFTFILSLILYYAGILIAYGGMSSDLRITAHYHGVVTSLTVALMGISFYILKDKEILKFEKLARWQPVIYTSGMFLLIIGLFLAGYYGAPRKTFGFNWIFDNTMVSYLNILGAGAVLSILGGVMFFVYVVISLINKLALRTTLPFILCASLFISFDTPDQKKFLGKDIANIEVFDRSGNKFMLYDLIKNKPVILSPIYTSCPHSCSLITANLKEVAEKIDGYGTQFTVISFSFDDADTPKDLDNFSKRWQLNGTDWNIISARKENIDSLLKSINFKIQKDEISGDYAHPNLAVVLTPKKRISRYIFGIFPDKKDLKLAIMEATDEKTSFSFYDGLYLNCFQYDVNSGTYVIDWSFLIQVFAGLSVIGSLSIITIRQLIT